MRIRATKFLKGNQGISLLTIVIYMVIAALLSWGGYTAYNKLSDKAKDSNINSDFQQFDTAASIMYRELNGVPLSGSSTTDLDPLTLNKYMENEYEISETTAGPLLHSIKEDPWGNPYRLFYAPSANGQILFVVSDGKDKTATFQPTGTVDLTTEFGPADAPDNALIKQNAGDDRVMALIYENSTYRSERYSY